jgi:hypothetical protein
VIVTDPKILAQLKAEAVKRKQMAGANGSGASKGRSFDVTQSC